MGPPDGQQDMAGVQGAGGTGRAGGGTDAPVVQQQKQTLSLDALKAEADIAKKPVCRFPFRASSRAAKRIAWLSASLPPEVKVISLGEAPMQAAIRVLASSWVSLAR